MEPSPKGTRLHIGILGRRNVGKSSLLNALTRQQVSIVSPVPGTTTDAVEKPMELLPLGPVLFLDTAGLDDEGELGKLRIGKTYRLWDRLDVAILVAGGEWGPFEENLLSELRGRGIPTLVAWNKTDVGTPPAALAQALAAAGIKVVATRADVGAGIADLREALIAATPADRLADRPLVADLVDAGGIVVLVVPIDREAPQGRLILPQVQVLRDVLDRAAVAVVAKNDELPAALAQLRRPPQLVVTDSQAFAQVAAATPADVPLTSFSILFSRYRGDLETQARGALAIATLRPGDAVLIAEACSHHPGEDDIGRVKIPRWLEDRAGGRLVFKTVQGHDFPEDLSPFKIVILCGGCMLNRREVLSRIARCQDAGVPVTNYGLAIAFCLGIFQRALSPFPQVLAAVSAGR